MITRPTKQQSTYCSQRPRCASVFRKCIVLISHIMVINNIYIIIHTLVEKNYRISNPILQEYKFKAILHFATILSTLRKIEANNYNN